MNGAWALTGGLSNRHEAPQLPYFIFFKRTRTRTLLLLLLDNIPETDRAGRGGSGFTIPFPHLLFSWVLSSAKWIRASTTDGAFYTILVPGLHQA